MAISKLSTILPFASQEVWNVVTSLVNYQWRSDLDKIEIVNETQFVEYTKEGIATTFTVTASEPCKRWEFDMENSNMKGHWSGIFNEENGQTQITFTEDVIVKKLIMKPFVKAFLKKQQEQYLMDLKKGLEEL